MKIRLDRLILTPVQAYILEKVRVKMKGIRKINGIRNTNPVAYAYMVKSFLILQEAGLFTESITEV